MAVSDVVVSVVSRRWTDLEAENCVQGNLVCLKTAEDLRGMTRRSKSQEHFVLPLAAAQKRKGL